jgi:hypothetical protein
MRWPFDHNPTTLSRRESDQIRFISVDIMGASSYPDELTTQFQRLTIEYVKHQQETRYAWHSGQNPIVFTSHVATSYLINSRSLYITLFLCCFSLVYCPDAQRELITMH